MPDYVNKEDLVSFIEFAGYRYVDVPNEIYGGGCIVIYGEGTDVLDTPRVIKYSSGRLE